MVNPIATILSAAMMLRHSLELEAEANAVESAVQAALEAGYRTRDIAGPSAGQSGIVTVGTREMGDAVAEKVAVA